MMEEKHAVWRLMQYNLHLQRIGWNDAILYEKNALYQKALLNTLKLC